MLVRCTVLRFFRTALASAADWMLLDRFQSQGDSHFLIAMTILSSSSYVFILRKLSCCVLAADLWPFDSKCKIMWFPVLTHSHFFSEVENLRYDITLSDGQLQSLWLCQPYGIDSANPSVEFVLSGRHVKAKPANVELVAKYESSKARAECCWNVEIVR